MKEFREGVFPMSRFNLSENGDRAELSKGKWDPCMYYARQIVRARPLQSGAQERVHGRQDGVQELRVPLALPGGGLGPHAVNDGNGSEVLSVGENN